MALQLADTKVDPNPVLMNVGSSKRLRLKPTQGATTSAPVTRPTPSSPRRRRNPRRASSASGTRMNRTSKVSSSRASAATPIDRPTTTIAGMLGRRQNR